MASASWCCDEVPEVGLNPKIKGANECIGVLTPVKLMQTAELSRGLQAGQHLVLVSPCMT